MIEVIFGIVLLIFGGEIAINTSEKISKKFGISNLTIGLSLIAIMTSLPEIFTNIASGIENEANIALGNVYGSNSSNALLIGGIALLFGVHQKKYKKTSNYLAVMAPIILYFFCLNSEITQLESIMLIFLYIFFSKTLFPTKKPKRKKERKLEMKLFFNIVVSVILLWFGGNMAVEGAISLSKIFGWSETFSGLILGFGTSLPELTVTFAAIKRKNLQMVSGNLIGSNIINPLVAMPFVTILGNMRIANNSEMVWWAVAGTVIYIFGTVQKESIKKIIGVISIILFVLLILNQSG